MNIFDKQTQMPVSADRLYRWHMQPGAFDALVPPQQKVEVLERPARLEEGAKLVMKVYLGPVGLRWVAVHRDFVQGRKFVDEQQSGPFAHWVHTHRFVPVDEDSSLLWDRVEYRLPAGKLGNLMGGWAIERMLDEMFEFRHAKTRESLAGDAVAGSR